MSLMRSKRDVLRAAAGACGMSLLAAGCLGHASAGSLGRPTQPRHTAPPPPLAVLQITPDRGHDVRPDQGVTITAAGGALTRVRVVAAGQVC